MRRRQGFTIVELLVAMALIIFIMSILSSAFVAATNTFRNLKALGDMAEKLRGTTQTLQRDLADDHFDGKKRMSNPSFWLNGPPSQGYFRIWQGSPSSDSGPNNFIEGVNPPNPPPYSGIPGIDGIYSYRSVDHALAFTVKRRGDQMGDFLSAGGGMAALSGSFGPAEARYQTSGNVYNFQWGEIVWFLKRQIDPTTGVQDVAIDQAATLSPTPLYTLYRRQRLLVPDNSLVNLPPGTPPPGTPVPASQIGSFLEISCWNNTSTGNIYFNGPFDVTVPQRRFNGGILTGCPTLQSQGAAPNLAGADIQLTDVISFDVRLLISAPGFVPPSPDPFVTLFQAPFTTPYTTAGGYLYSNPGSHPNKGPMFFDTWSSLQDGLANYSTWNVPGQPTSIPLWNQSTQTGPLIQAIQVSIRIWDSKTNQSRQVTIVQAM